MTLPPFPFVPASPEERLRLTQYGELVRAMYKDDAERLDWLSRQDLMDLVFGFVVDAAHDGEYAINAGRGLFYGKTLRAAIDAARSGGKGDRE